MRLTNEMRKDFADRVVAKIPMKSEWTREKIIAELEKRLLATWPKEVLDFRKKHPHLMNIVSVNVDWLSYRDEGRFHYEYASAIVGSKLHNIECDDLKNHWQEILDETKKRKETKQRIYDQACGCTTLAQLEVVFPDLKGLMPKPVVNVKHLPVAAKGLTDDLVKLGLEIPQ